MKKNILFTFVCACAPGFGQMYYGYMRRGTSLALWFWGLVFFASLSGLGMVGILLPVIWAYSFFDTFNIRSLSPEQYAAFGDDYIPSREWVEQLNLGRVFNKSKGYGKLLGWALIIFGCLIIYNVLFSRVLWYLYDYIPFLGYFIEAIPPLFVAGVVILLGLSVLRGKKPKFLDKDQDDNYAYKGYPQEPTPPTSTYNTVPGWDARTNPGPTPGWDYSAAAQQTPPAAEPSEPAPVVEPAPIVPPPPAPVVNDSIELTLETPASTIAAAEQAMTEPTEATEETTSDVAEDKKEEAPAETPEEKPAKKKGKKKEEA